MKNIPALLIWFRFFAGFILIGLSLSTLPAAPILCAIILALGVLSDIFDGVIARKYNVSTVELRQWDSRIDVIFWVCTAASLMLIHPNLQSQAWLMIIILSILEITTRLISQIRFKREASTHHILSKIFTLFLWALLSYAFIAAKFGILYWTTLIIGIISQIEAMIIMSIIPIWSYDIKGLKQALKMRAEYKMQ